MNVNASITLQIFNKNLKMLLHICLLNNRIMMSCTRKYLNFIWNELHIIKQQLVEIG